MIWLVIGNDSHLHFENDSHSHLKHQSYFKPHHKKQNLPLTTLSKRILNALGGDCGGQFRQLFQILRLFIPLNQKKPLFKGVLLLLLITYLIF